MIVNVVSPEEEYFSGESTMVVTRTPNGEIGIYSGHEATVATILPGGLTIEHSGGKDSYACLLYTSPSPRDLSTSRMPSSA